MVLRRRKPVYAYNSYQPADRTWSKKLWLFFAFLFIALVALLTFSFYRYSQPVGKLMLAQPKAQADNSKAITKVNWPTSKQASVGSVEQGLLASKPKQVTKPTASTAKLIAVLTILKKKPLRLDEQGPKISVTQKDIELYDKYFAEDGSLVKVKLGEELTQYQMLQGILVRSANNLTDSLAIWAYGSLPEYQKAAQAMVNSLGMQDTVVGPDASGYNPATVSTAEDLTRLGIAAMKNPVIREIVKQESINLPVDGKKQNTNWLLGTDGVVGIKTGNTDEAGGVFIVASEYKVAGEKPVTIVGTVQGEKTIFEAIEKSRQLVKKVQPRFVKNILVHSGQKVAHVTTPWGEKGSLIARQDLSVFGWKDKLVKPKITLTDYQLPLQKGTKVGEISVGNSSADLITTKDISAPTWQWRVLRN